MNPTFLKDVKLELFGEESCFKMLDSKPLDMRMTESEAKKDDGNKVMLELLPFEALEEVGRVLRHGKDKYAAHNWRKGTQWSRFLGAALRHLFAWASGEDKDPESSLSHIAHALCCLLFLMSYIINKNGTDDRYKLGNPENAA